MNKAESNSLHTGVRLAEGACPYCGETIVAVVRAVVTVAPTQPVRPPQTKPRKKATAKK